MMKKLGILILVCAVFFTASAALAEKGAHEKALENARDEAIFNRVGDWFATIGKSAEEKAAIKVERREARRLKRIHAEKLAQVDTRIAEKEAAKAQKIAQKKAKKAEKEARKAEKKAACKAKEAKKAACSVKEGKKKACSLKGKK